MRLTRHDFAYVTMAQRDQRGSLSHRLAPTPHFGAPPLIYHPCQCRASAAAPGFEQPFLELPHARTLQHSQTGTTKLTRKSTRSSGGIYLAACISVLWPCTQRRRNFGYLWCSVRRLLVFIVEGCSIAPVGCLAKTLLVVRSAFQDIVVLDKRGWDILFRQ